MKNKLKKDLKFLRTWKGKLPTSLAVSFLSSWIADVMYGVRGAEEMWLFLGVVFVITYIALYFFNAWIVGDEEGNESSNVEN